jgi:hypothetical protein
VPAAVTDGIIQRRADRSARRLDVGAAVDQRLGHVHIVAAGRPVQRCLGLGVAGGARAGVGAGLDEDGDDGRAVEEVAGPVGHDVQRRPGAAVPPGDRLGGQREPVGQKLLNRDDIPGLDGLRQYRLDRGGGGVVSLHAQL